MTAKNGTFEGRPHSDGSVIQLTYRRTLSQRLQGLVNVAVVMGLCFFASPWWNTPGRLGGFIGACTGAVLVTLFERNGTELGADGVTLRRFLRADHVVPWASVADVQLRTRVGTRYLVLCRYDGQQVRLPAPMGGFSQHDGTFETKRSTVLAWWAAARAAQGLPPTPALRRV